MSSEGNPTVCLLVMITLLNVRPTIRITCVSIRTQHGASPGVRARGACHEGSGVSGRKERKGRQDYNLGLVAKQLLIIALLSMTSQLYSSSRR